MDISALSGSSNRCDRFSGADLASLVREAATVTLRRALPAGDPNPNITASDFDVAFTKASSTALRKAEEKNRRDRKNTVRKKEVLSLFGTENEWSSMLEVLLFPLSILV